MGAYVEGGYNVAAAVSRGAQTFARNVLRGMDPESRVKPAPQPAQDDTFVDPATRPSVRRRS